MWIKWSDRNGDGYDIRKNNLKWTCEWYKRKYYRTNWQPKDEINDNC